MRSLQPFGSPRGCGPSIILHESRWLPPFNAQSSFVDSCGQWGWIGRKRYMCPCVWKKKRQASSLLFIKTLLFANGNLSRSNEVERKSSHCFSIIMTVFIHAGFLKRIFHHARPANFVVNEKCNTTWGTIKMDTKVKMKQALIIQYISTGKILAN